MRVTRQGVHGGKGGMEEGRKKYKAEREGEGGKSVLWEG